MRWALAVAVAALAWPAAASAAREPMGTELRSIDGTPVVLQYGIPVPAFEGVEAREQVSLDRVWRFRFEDGVDGLAAGWHEPGFDDSGWERREVPSSWDLYDTPGFGGYDGSLYGQGTAFRDGNAWYRVAVDVPRGWERRRVLAKFLAVAYSADVYVNGSLAGRHEGASAPFALDVGALLRPGRSNVIAVRVHRRPWWDSYTAPAPQPIADDREIPHKPVDYWPYAGIVRSAWLEATPRVAASKLLVTGDPERRRVTVRAVVENSAARAREARVALVGDPRSGGPAVAETVVVPAGGVRVVTLSRAAPRARPWSADRPALYRARVQVTAPGQPADRLSAEYGLRSVAVRDGRLEVNGEPVFLKGVNWHEETPDRGRSLARADYDRLLGDVGALGANAIRNAVYTRHPYVYEWADRHGVYVIDDIDTMWLNEPQQRFQLAEYGLSRALALTMAWNQANHPSVLLWCLQNESEIGPSYRAWLADMKAAARAADPHDRPITWASSSSNDPAFDLADVVGFNEYFGYFYGRDEDLGPALDATHRAHPDKPIVITENGTFSYPGRRGSPDEMGTEEWQAEKLRRHWAQVVERPFLAGYMFWLMRDYKERMAYNRFEYNGISAMGLSDFHGVRRLAFFAYRGATGPASGAR